MLKECLRMSWQNIKGNKMRTFLTTLGIIIGVTAIITLITTVEGATNEITSQFTALGAGKVNVSISGTPLKRGLSDEDLQQLNTIDNISGIDPSVSFSQHVAGDGSLCEDVTIEGRSAAYFADGDLISMGRGLSDMDMDRHSHVCVIDSDLHANLFPNEDPIGKEIVISGLTFRVVGMLSDESENDVMSAMSAMMGGDSNGTIIIPYQVALRLTDTNSITSMTIYIQDTDLTDDTISDVEDVLNAAFNYRDNAYQVINLDSLLDTMNTMTGMMTTMLAGIASIALLVGGIGIMNMMLVSVSERTMEIGLRKALGARPSLIQAQFLIESVMLSLMGGLIGIIVGILLSALIANLIGIAFTLSTDAIILAFTFSASVGILFGWAPARKASRLNPIDALRSM